MVHSGSTGQTAFTLELADAQIRSDRVHLISAISTGLTCQLLILILISLHMLHLFKNKYITRRMSAKAKLWYICTVGKDVVVASGILLFVYC